MVVIWCIVAFLRSDDSNVDQSDAAQYDAFRATIHD